MSGIGKCGWCRHSETMCQRCTCLQWSIVNIVSTWIKKLQIQGLIYDLLVLENFDWIVKTIRSNFSPWRLVLTDWLNVFIITSDKPQMKLHVQCINDKVCTIKKKKKTSVTASLISLLLTLSRQYSINQSFLYWHMTKRICWHLIQNCNTRNVNRNLYTACGLRRFYRPSVLCDRAFVSVQIAIK